MGSVILANLPALLVVVPLLLAPISTLFTFAGLGWAIALLGTGASLIFALLLQSVTETGARISYHLGNWEPPWGIEFVVDSASSLTLVVMSGLGFLATLAARQLVINEIAEKDIGKFYAAWLLVSGGLFGLVMTADAFNLFVFLEISALASVILIGMGAGTDRRALVAAYHYLVIGAVGATFYVIGVGFIYAMTGSLNMVDIANRIPDASGSAAIYVGFGFMVAGILVKAAIFPVHIWLPAAYSYAPSAVSTLLASIATKAALYVLARILFTVFGGMPDVVTIALSNVIVPLAVGGDELYAGVADQNCLQVFSFTGVHRRSLRGDWRMPSYPNFCVENDRVYLVAAQGADGDGCFTRSLLVLSKHGEILQVYTHSLPSWQFSSIIFFDGKLLVSYRYCEYPRNSEKCLRSGAFALQRL